MSAWMRVALLVLVSVLPAGAMASDAGYLYGRVVTVAGEEFEGPLRWGKEEAFWHDVFNANKVENEHLKLVDDRVLERLRWREPWKNLGGLFGDDDSGFRHVLAVRFGDLARIRVRDRDELVAEFRNGESLELGDGSNDVGAVVTVLDAKQGRQEIAWKRIRTVEFRETPAKLPKKLGEPLYGTVRSRELEFTGHIQWDHDECLSIDELDGETRDGDMSIEFGDIASIRKQGRGAQVTLKSGKTVFLTGSNDVNRGNRGVLVKIAGLGSVKIGWDDFEQLTFQPAPHAGRGYAEYGAGRELTGTVTARGKRLSGRIVYDLDEAWDFELLHGRNRDTDYLIPFREIARIRPRGFRRSDVVLRSGLTVELKDNRDISRGNDGLLVFTGSGKPTYVAWRDVDEIVFP